MKKVFRMDKMIARLKAEGRIHMVDDDAYAMMKKLDGKVGDDYNWQSVVRDEPLVWIAPQDGLDEGAYVNVVDCDNY